MVGNYETGYYVAVNKLDELYVITTLDDCLNALCVSCTSTVDTKHTLTVYAIEEKVFVFHVSMLSRWISI